MLRKVAVVGAGIAGISIAYQLAKQGINITIYEKELYPAMGTSYANGAQLSVSNSQTWNTWPMVNKGLHWMFKKDAPFYIGSKLDYDKIKWLIKFLNSTRRHEYEANTRRTIELALKSREEYNKIIDEEYITFNQVRKGILHVYTTLKSFQIAIDESELMHSSGCDWETLYSEEVKQIDPALQHNNLIVGGIYTQDDSSGDCHQFVNNLTKILIEKYNVKVNLGHNVQHMSPIYSEVIIDEEAYDDVIIATGCDSQKWGKKFGDKLDIYPVKGYSINITLPNSEFGYAPWVSLLDDDAKIVCSRIGMTQLRIAGTAELDGYNLDIRKERIQPLLNWVHEWFPHIDTRKYSPWSGLRPMTPNMMPHFHKGQHNRVWYHTGHGHLGWTLSMGTAKELAKIMLDK